MLRIAIDPAFSPFEFVDGEGTLVGLDVDLGRQIAARLDVEAHFVTTGYDALYDALTVGRADVIISALYPDPNRMQAFVFSRSYFNAGEVLLVPEASAIAAADDLPGERVALVFGTEAHVEALRWEKSLHPSPVLLIEDSPEAVVALLTEGQADAAIVDRVTAHIALARTAGLRVLLPSITDEPYTIAARKEDADLIEAIDEIIEALQTGGELDALVGQWMR
jgi:polar amino acid transport system substrate-binding protein